MRFSLILGCKECMRQTRKYRKNSRLGNQVLTKKLKSNARIRGSKKNREKVTKIVKIVVIQQK